MFYLFIWIFFLIDFISKYFVVHHLKEKIPLLGDFLYIQLVFNPWIAFSVQLNTILLKILTISLIFVIFWYYRKEEKKKQIFLIDISFALILGGALGNAYERIFSWEVVDFIGVKYFSVFNWADIFLSLGIILYLIYIIFLSKKYDKKW